MNGEPLLGSVTGLLRRTYRIEREVPSPAEFLIGDRGLRRFYMGDGDVRICGTAAEGEGARTMVRETVEGLRAAIYLPDAMVRALEVDPPQRGVHERNVDAFATFVEEVDHFLCIADRALLGRPVSLFELELHANVSKRLVVGRFLAGRTGRLSERDRLWLEWHLFHKGTWSDPDPEVRQRYVDAARWAIRFLGRCAPLGPGERLNVLRRFHRASASGKIRLIEAMAG